jgi:hypothetical protein
MWSTTLSSGVVREIFSKFVSKSNFELFLFFSSAEDLSELSGNSLSCSGVTSIMTVSNSVI